MNIDKRYRFWRILWVVLGIYLFFSVIGIITLSVSPDMSESANLNKLLEWRHLLDQAISIVFSATFYYFFLNTFYKLYATRMEAALFIRPIVLAIVILIVYYILSYYLLEERSVEASVSKGVIRPNPPLALRFVGYTIAIGFYIGISLVVSYLTHLRDERKQRKVLEEQKMQLEVEKSQANFNFLKAQINPHFLHNTLNFLYAKSLPYSPELSEGILTLSEIMRYALSEGNSRDGKAPLKDEIEHLRNVIKINQLRFSNNLKVQLEVEGLINGAQIIPFVLITLVENAFKHGDLKSMEHPIEIRVLIEGKKLYFFCRNKKKTGPKELSTGIGLDNIKKRLDLAYGTHYQFIIKDEADIYTTELTIDPL
jgi:two-component system LytT family sensor kinase